MSLIPGSFEKDYWKEEDDPNENETNPFLTWTAIRDFISNLI